MKLAIINRLSRLSNIFSHKLCRLLTESFAAAVFTLSGAVLKPHHPHFASVSQDGTGWRRGGGGGGGGAWENVLCWER